MLDAGNRRSVVGCPTGGNQDIFRRDGLAGRKAQRVGVLDHGARLDDLRAGLLHIGGVDIFRAGRSPCPCWRPWSPSRTWLMESFQPKPAASSIS
jgi:hypothetical protein